jgi:hypothetical protein
MLGIGRQVQSAGQRTVKVSFTHEHRDDIAAPLATLTSSALQKMSAITEQWTALQRLTFLLTYLLRGWLAGNGSPACLAKLPSCSVLRQPSPSRQNQRPNTAALPAEASPFLFLGLLGMA